MFHPDLIIYFWVFLLFVFFIFSVLCLPLIFIAGRKIFSKVELVRGTRPDSTHLRCANEKRKHSRHDMEGIFAQFIDGANSCRVPIKNISLRGVCFGYPPDKLEPFTGNLGLKIGGPGKNIIIQIKLLWRQLREDEQYVGAKVQNSPATWENIISNLENPRISHAADRQIPF